MVVGYGQRTFEPIGGTAKQKMDETVKRRCIVNNIKRTTYQVQLNLSVRLPRITRW